MREAFNGRPMFSIPTYGWKVNEHSRRKNLLNVRKTKIFSLYVHFPIGDRAARVTRSFDAQRELLCLAAARVALRACVCRLARLWLNRFGPLLLDARRIVSIFWLMPIVLGAENRSTCRRSHLATKLSVRAVVPGGGPQTNKSQVGWGDQRYGNWTPHSEPPLRESSDVLFDFLRIMLQITKSNGNVWDSQMGEWKWKRKETSDGGKHSSMLVRISSFSASMISALSSFGANQIIILFPVETMWYSSGKRKRPWNRNRNEILALSRFDLRCCLWPADISNQFTELPRICLRVFPAKIQPSSVSLFPLRTRPDSDIFKLHDAANDADWQLWSLNMLLNIELIRSAKSNRLRLIRVRASSTR